MSADARLKIAQGTASVGVTPCRKFELAQATDAHPDRTGDLDQ